LCELISGEKTGRTRVPHRVISMPPSIRTSHRMTTMRCLLHFPPNFPTRNEFSATHKVGFDYDWLTGGLRRFGDKRDDKVLIASSYMSQIVRPTSEVDTSCELQTKQLVQARFYS